MRVAYARQSHEVKAEGTVLDAFLGAFAEVLELRHALTEAQHAAASGTDAALAAALQRDRSVPPRRAATSWSGGSP